MSRGRRAQTWFQDEATSSACRRVQAGVHMDLLGKVVQEPDMSRCERIGMTAPIQAGSEAPWQEQDGKAPDSKDPGERTPEDAQFG